MKLPTLYKRSKTGAILQWSVITDNGTYCATHGQVGGKLIVDTPTICEAKNVGRSNEVLPLEQAVLEARRIWAEKQKYHGYTDDVKKVDETADNPSYFEPTLAVERKASTAKFLPKEIFISPKLDGLRCVITKDGAFTRRGKRYISTKFIEEALEPFFEANPNVLLDGELYNHALKDDFNKITSLARKAKAESIKEKDWETIRDILQLHVFDCKDLDRPDLDFVERQELIRSAQTLEIPFIVVVPQSTIPNNDETVKKFHDDYTDLGYEGAMVRDGSEPYHCGRVKTLQKVKIFTTEEFEIVDFTAGKGKMANKAARVVVRMKNGTTSDAGLNYKHAECVEFLENKANYIGKLATIKYFNLTPDGKLRFGKMIDFNRDDL